MRRLLAGQQATVAVLVWVCNELQNEPQNGFQDPTVGDPPELAVLDYWSTDEPYAIDVERVIDREMRNNRAAGL